MVVCAHGDVATFCRQHGMEIFERYSGSLDDYNGSCAVLVTDMQLSMEEYEDWKCLLFGRGVELVSTRWSDDEFILRLLHTQVRQRKQRGGRQMFGFYKKNGVISEVPELIAVARRVIILRDRGYTLRQIQQDKGVHHLGGRSICMSTIQQILKNREVYEQCDEPG